MRILSFGTYDTASHPRVGVLVEGLRCRGHEVVEANAPLGLPTAARVAMVRRPASSWRLGVRLVSRWATLVRRTRSLRRAGPVDAVLVGYLGWFDVLVARALFPRTPVVLDQLVFAADTARDRGVGSRPTLAALRAVDALACAAADLVLVDTEENAGLVPARWRDKALAVPVGASRAWFDAARSAPPAGEPTRTSAEPMRVVFFGLYTPLQGAAVIGRALARLAGRLDVEATMVGTGQDLAEARRAAAANPRVRWVDWVDAADLPALVAAHDVCLGIFGTTPKAGRVVPNKVYQGAAAGCAVVTSDTAPQRRALGDAALYVTPGDAEQLAGCLDALAGDRERLAGLRRRAAARARAAFGPGPVADRLGIPLGAAEGRARRL